MNQEKYKKTVGLLLDVLPLALQDERVALKGGTAINLFHRNFPRFSVDIDLCYLPLEDRAPTYKNLHEILRILKHELEKKLGLFVRPNQELDGKREAKLIASRDGIEIKIEPNFVLRSSLFAPVEIDLAKNAVIDFEKNVKARCLNLADTYGGKICAALDRQHPRDLYDVKYLFENEGITRDLKDSFIFYLISHNRPIDELLNPNLKNIKREYEDEFVNMAKNEVSLDDLEKTREELVFKINSMLDDNDRKFLLSFVRNGPDWSLVRDSKIQDYPSVRWKLMNQASMKADKNKAYVSNLEKILANI